MINLSGVNNIRTIPDRKATSLQDSFPFRFSTTDQSGGMTISMLTIIGLTAGDNGATLQCSDSINIITTKAYKIKVQGTYVCTFNVYICWYRKSI